MRMVYAHLYSFWELRIWSCNEGKGVVCVYWRHRDGLSGVTRLKIIRRSTDIVIHHEGLALQRCELISRMKNANHE
jgi:hypothetical protein